MGRMILNWLLIFLQILIGISALVSGAMLFLGPDGHLVGFTQDVLEGSPFNSFLIPGIVLFLFVGVFPVITACGLIKPSIWKPLNVLNPFKARYWSWTASWAVGVIMLIWISVETILLGYISFLQPLIAGWALAILILTWLPPMRKKYRVQKF
jgi:hypothetical protein